MCLIARIWILAVAVLFGSSLLPARAVEPDRPAQVMLLGTFHFANPGRDRVKGQVIDVMTEPNQAYLERLATRIVAFQPTDVLLECTPSDQPRVDRQFDDFRKGIFDLPSNEIYQIGFRVAERAGLTSITCFDEDQIGWQAQPMFEYMEAHDAAAKRDIDALFRQLSEEMNREQMTLSLAELLQLANDPARDALNKSIYLRTNAVGAGDGFAGADASASWWHRNFRMYAAVQKSAHAGRRVFVLAGQGHTAIMRDLLAMDDRRTAADVRDYVPDPK